MIVWLASYPKSGNTWFRALLSNYLSDSDEPVDINKMATGPIASARVYFDECIGVAASDLTFPEVVRLRPQVYRQLAQGRSFPLFVKAHDAYLYSLEGDPVFPPEATRAALYLVRNPLDVCISYAHHNDCPIEQAITMMADPKHQLAPRGGGLPGQLPQRLGSWSGHVRSWLRSKLPVQVIRYEDLKADTQAVFSNALAFCGLECDPGRVRKAVEFADFKKLKQQESEKGFQEKPINAKSFFRQGRSGGWRDQLTPNQVEQIVSDHSEVMAELGYELPQVLPGCREGNKE
ncbi:MAG: sulfotransferase domain-containing protein [Vulcanimicrobiota bacterium]